MRLTPPRPVELSRSMGEGKPMRSEQRGIYCVYTGLEDGMNTKVRKVGNSYTVTIPRGLADELALQEGSEVVVTREDDMIVIKPAESKWDRFVVRAREEAVRKGLTEMDVLDAVREIRGR